MAFKRTCNHGFIALGTPYKRYQILWDGIILPGIYREGIRKEDEVNEQKNVLLTKSTIEFEFNKDAKSYSTFTQNVSLIFVCFMTIIVYFAYSCHYSYVFRTQ